jgi:hypothetical protein
MIIVNLQEEMDNSSTMLPLFQSKSDILQSQMECEIEDDFDFIENKFNDSTEQNVNVNVQQDHNIILPEPSSFAPNSQVLQRAIQFGTEYFPNHENYQFFSNQNMGEEFYSLDATLPKTSNLLESVEQYFEIQELQAQINHLKCQEKIRIFSAEQMAKQQAKQNHTIDDLRKKLERCENSRYHTLQIHRAVNTKHEIMHKYHENEVSELKKKNEKIKEIFKNEIMEKNKLLENTKRTNDTLMHENYKLRKKLTSALEKITSSKK